VLERENDLKTYHSVLNEEMKKFHDCLHRIPLPLRPLLSGMVDDLEAKFEPGRTTLTWVSVNIDAFLASVEGGISELNEVADTAASILTQRIERVLKRVKSLSLIDISDSKTYTLGGGGLETFISDQQDEISRRAAQVASMIRGAEEALEELVSLVPSPYAFHTDDNHYERDLKVRFGFLAYQAVRGCVIHTLNVLKNRLVAGPTGLFYITRPIFDVDVELQYPHVALVPSLGEIQEAINEVALCVSTGMQPRGGFRLA
jgi:hypothetical protein